MIREALDSVYKRTLGSLRDWLGSLASSMAGGGLVTALYMVYLVVLLAGFVNAFLNQAVISQTYIPYPNGTVQTIPEGVINAFVIAMGGGGVYLTYMSGRQTVRSRTVNMYLGLALLLLVVSLFTGVEMAIMKGLG